MNQHDPTHIPGIIEIEVIDDGGAFALIVGGVERVRLHYDHAIARDSQRAKAINEAHVVSRGLGMAGIACSINNRLSQQQPAECECGPVRHWQCNAGCRAQQRAAA